MTLKPVGFLKAAAALFFLQVVTACGGGDKPPPAGDTSAPTTRAQPAGGTFTAAISVTLTCTDSGSSGCAATHYTTDGSAPSDSSPSYSAPIALSSNTTLKFFSVDNAGNKESVKTETYAFNIGGADTTAPTVTASPAGGTYTAAQSVTLSCNDGAGSGCASIRYTTDGSAPTAASTAYSTPIAIGANTTLKFIGIDNVGNTSAVSTETYVINLDTAAPTVTASPAGGTYTASQSVTLTCDDGTGTGCASIHYTTDGSTPTASSPAYSAAIAISVSTTLKFIGIDNAGNTSAVSSEAYVINRDTTAPSVVASPVGGTYTTVQSVTLTCNDGTGTGCASIHYTTDGSTPTASSPAYTGPISIGVSTTLKFIATDNAGNTSTVRTETYAINLDTTAPSVVASPVGGTYNTAQSVTLTCSDSGSGCASIRYTTDGSTPTASSPAYSAPVSISANTVLKFIAIDNAGNTSTVRTETYVIDTAAPTVVASPVGGTYNATQTVTLTCSDSGTGCASIRYTTDGSTPTASSPAYSTPISISANTALKFIGIDNAGNTSTVRTETYVIDTAAPTVTASPVGGTYNATQPVTLTCSDSGSGCASIRYTTDGSTPTASSPAYSTPISISANTTLKFIGIDNAGNTSTVRTETYVIDTAAPTVAANPVGGTYFGAQSVTLTCNDGTGTGCASIRYTTDGSTPTASSPAYSTPISISANTALKFIGIDNAGNTSTVRTETYVINADTTPPTTTATPAGGVYATTQNVTLACNDGSGSGCGSIYYTVDGSTPTTGSPRYTGPIAISATTTLKFYAVDLSGNPETVKTQQYYIGSTPANTSAQIAAVRAAANGTVNLPISLALVTYVKPLVGTDAAGFFLQAEQAGPAVFIAVDPATLTPAPVAGDRVSLTATTKATVSSMVHVTAISGYARNGGGESVEPLRADVTTVDVPGSLANYESELISISGTLSTAFAASGTGHTAANLLTVGYPSGTALQLRLPTTLQDQLDVAQNCSITANAPLWRFNTNAQASAWVPADLSILSCPAPKVVSAAARSSTTVAVQFDRRIAPATVQANGSQFTFDNGLSASSATLTDREVLLTTVAQTGGQPYTVTVSTSVTDTRGTALSSTANTATFTGYQAPAVLRITEVAPNITNAKDLVELYVVQGGSVSGFTLVQDSSTVLATFPAVQVATGDIIVVHSSPSAGTTDGPGSELTAKNQYPNATYSANYDNAWDFHGNTTGITYSSRILRVKSAQGVTQDGIPFVRTTGTPPASFPTELQALQAEGLWLPANCGGAPCSSTSTPTASAVSAVWEGVSTGTATTVRRASGADTNTLSDWSVGASNFGVYVP